MSEIAENDFTGQLMEFVCTNFTHANADELSADDPLLDTGVVDSLGLLEIVEFIEAQFCVTITLNDMSPENFGTINAMAGFISRSTADAG